MVSTLPATACSGFSSLREKSLQKSCRVTGQKMRDVESEIFQLYTVILELKSQVQYSSPAVFQQLYNRQVCVCCDSSVSYFWQGCQPVFPLGLTERMWAILHGKEQSVSRTQQCHLLALVSFWTRKLQQPSNRLLLFYGSSNKNMNHLAF